MKYIVLIHAAVYVLNMFSRGSALYGLLAFSPDLIAQGQVWRLVSFLLLPPSGGPLVVVLYLYFYWFIGTTLEREWGPAKFTLFYFLGGLFTLAAGFILSLWGLGSVIDMYYVNMSMFLAFATLYPDLQVLFFFVIPMKVKWLAWLDLALFAYQCIRYVSGGLWMLCLLPLAALLNYLVVFWPELAERLGLFRYRHSRQTINFKQATKKAQQQKGYLHKCAVCGKTDTDYPNEEFRYCSKCNGYYCYCSEHIHNPVHIT